MRPRKQPNPKSSFGPWALSAITIASIASPIVVEASARAATLNAWNFDQASRTLTLTLPNSVTPDVFLLAEPTRIVLEIPNTTLGAITPSAQYSGAVRNIRLTEVSGGSRVVIELAPNTRLDPRHAELTATELGNGQTEWLLVPLLQDVPAAPVATAPPAPVAAPAGESSAVSSARDPVTEPSETDPAETDIAIADNSEVATEDVEDSDDVALSSEEQESAVAIAVTPTPESPAVAAEALPEPAFLPDIAASATVGAVRALPTGPDPLAGVSTDASALAGAVRDNLSDRPPEQLPIDPFAASSQAMVSVPSLAEADSTPAPAVAVPPLAAVPNVPEATQSSNPQQPNLATPPAVDVAPNQARPPGNQERAIEPAVTATAPAIEPPPPSGMSPSQVRPSTITATAPVVEPTPTAGIAPNQVRPPRRQSEPTVAPAAPTAPTPTAGIAPNQIRPPRRRDSTIATAPPIEATIRPPTASGSPDVVAANSLGVPTVPLPPDRWRDYGDGAIPPNQVRPSNVAAAVPSTAAATAIAAAATLRPPGSPNVQPAAAPTVRQPASPITVAAEMPPFLSSPSAAASEVTPSAPATERRSIPPPPPLPNSNGTVPFGAPLPQSQSSGDTSQLNGSYPAFLPAGTRLPLQYEGTDTLVLATREPVYETLTLTDDVYDPDTGMLVLSSGAQVSGRFEGASDRDNERRFVAQSITYGPDRYPLPATSGALAGTRQYGGREVSLSSGIGAAAITVLSGFSSVGLFGGPGMGVLARFSDAPTLVAIAPGTEIEVAVVADVRSSNEAPTVSQQHP